jgi:hypothetical protein
MADEKVTDAACTLLTSFQKSKRMLSHPYKIGLWLSL